MAEDRPRGFGIAAGLDPDVGREVAQRCESLGYASLWSNDHPAASGLETVAVFAEAAPQPDVGVAVLALDRHAPGGRRGEALRGRASPPARLWLGIGAGFTKRPLGVVREGLAGAARGAAAGGADRRRRDGARRCAPSRAPRPTACSSTG